MTSVPPADSAVDASWLAGAASRHEQDLLALRRDLHAHPELGRAEVRTTRVLRERLEAAGLEPRVLPGGTGLLCDIGTGARLVGLRADIDALPLQDTKDVPYRSTVDGVCHACGHDVHAAVLLGAGLVLSELAADGSLPGRVRLVFQPAEELTPGGALDVVAAGGLEEVEAMYALHCDPRTPVGKVGVREGPITASADQVTVRLHGTGGHTARPHLTADLVHALATVATGLPSLLSRRVDPRAGLSVVWGRIAAGGAPNAIPRSGELSGTLRCLDPDAWQRAPELVTALVTSLVEPFGVQAEVAYTRGVPPVINDGECADVVAAAAREVLGDAGVTTTEQSLGGEDFAWYLDKVPGALARLGTAGPLVGQPGAEPAHDLHQSTFDVDERAVALGVRVLVATALVALR